MRRLLLALLFALSFAGAGRASTCPSLPYTLLNGTIADASQVMANFTSLLNCQDTLLAPLASPVFNGIPAAPTAAPGTNTTQLATTAFVTAAAVLGANPTATATGAAINGTATTFMRSDAAPAIQIATTAQLGLIQLDGTTIGESGGIATVQPTTVAGVSCSPGSSCTLAAADLTDGVTGTGNIVLTNVPTIASPAVTGNATFGGNILATALPSSPGNAAVCISTSSHNMAYSTGGCSTSDARLKHDWSYDIPGLSMIMQLHPGHFDWLDAESAKAGRQAGLPAQAVAAMLPEIVATHDDQTITLADGTRKLIPGVKSLDYGKLVLPLIMAVQQQQAEIEDLRRRLEGLGR
jgi:hypothetical protein